MLAGLNLVGWIVPWVALVVGLHFVPLGYLLRLKQDYLTAAAILLLTVGIVLLMPMAAWALQISVGMALVLWLAGWGRLAWIARAPDA